MNEAIQKLDREQKAYKADRYGAIMQIEVAEALRDFCRQNEEFARAVLQGGTFGDCMKELSREAQKHGGGWSDAAAYRKASQFYFPGCEVEVRMVIHMSKYEAEDAGAGNVLNLRLEDLL